MSNTEMQFEKTLLNQRSLRAAVRPLTLDQIDEAIEKLTAVRAERYEAEKEQIEAEKARQAKLAEFRELMKEEGIDPADLIAGVETTTTTKQKAKRAPRPAKYEYLNADGERMTWTGQGRQPRAIADAIAEGSKTLEDFEIKAAAAE